MYRTYQACRLSSKQSQRIKHLKEESINVNQEVCIERARYLTEGYKEHADEPAIKKRAYAFQNILKKISLFIEDGQLLAGNHAASLRAASIFPEYCVNWLLGFLPGQWGR